CDVVLPIGDRRVYQMPELPIPEGRTLAEQLRVQSYQGLMGRYPNITEELFREYLAAARGAGSADEIEESALDEVLLELARHGENGRRAKAEGETYDSFEYPHLAVLKERNSDTDALTILERAEFELG